jgi:hypothetical protein
MVFPDSVLFHFGTALGRIPNAKEPGKAVPVARLSKIEYYLVDNLQVIRLSYVKGLGQEESERGTGPSSNLGI